jgi:hypothetical protein
MGLENRTRKVRWDENCSFLVSSIREQGASLDCGDSKKWSQGSLLFLRSMLCSYADKCE